MGTIRRILVVVVVTATTTAALGTMPATAAERETAPVMWMPPSGNAGLVPGASATLGRTGDGLSYTFHTHGLERQHAYTVWWVIFNEPEECTTNPAGPVRCGAGDLGNPAVLGSLQFGGGHAAGGSGRGVFGGSIRVGDTTGCEPGLPCNGGLVDPGTAEVHLVVRTHDRVIPGSVSSQIGSFNGGCNAAEPNEGLCRNLQAAAFA